MYHDIVYLLQETNTSESQHYTTTNFNTVYSRVEWIHWCFSCYPELWSCNLCFCWTIHALESAFKKWILVSLYHEPLQNRPPLSPTSTFVQKFSHVLCSSSWEQFGKRYVTLPTGLWHLVEAATHCMALWSSYTLALWSKPTNSLELCKCSSSYADSRPVYPFL